MAVGLVAFGPVDAALFGLWKSKGRSVAAVEQSSLVVFPFDQGDVARVPATFGEYVAGDVRSILSSSDRFSAYLYKERLAPIARAKSDNTLRPADAAGPYAEDRTKTWKLAQLLASDLYVAGSIDDYQVDSAKKVAMITLSAELVDARTGRLLKTMVVTGRTPENAQAVEEEELRDMAKGDAVTKLCAEIMAPKKSAEPAPAPDTPPAAEAPKPEAQAETPTVGQ